MTSRCFYFAEKELIPLILLTQRMCPPDTVSVMITQERGAAGLSPYNNQLFKRED